MKATGITRRIDDLGRVVIPKEIRRTLRIREGDPLEIFTDREGGIILKKYSTMEDLSDFAGKYADALSTQNNSEIPATTAQFPPFGENCAVVGELAMVFRILSFGKPKMPLLPLPNSRRVHPFCQHKT